MQETFRLGQFYPGVARIYRKIQVPIIPIALLAPRRAMKEYPRLKMIVEGHVYRCVMVLGGPFCVNIGESFLPNMRDGDESEDNLRIMADLKERMRALIEDVRVNKFWL